MKTFGKEIFIVVQNVPAGKYPGVWGGYEVEFSVGKKDFVCKTEDGIRGLNVSCFVEVDSNGKVTVTTG